MNPLFAAVLGATAGLAIWLALVTVFSRPDAVDPNAPAGPQTGKGHRWARRVPWAGVGAAGAAGATMWLLTGWPVAVAGAAVLAWAAPVLFGGERAHRVELARINAVAAWAESLRDVIGAAAGLEQAIRASAASPPPAIRSEVEALAADLRSGVGMEAAMRAFAVRLGDETADLVAMALIGAANRAGNLAPVLDDLTRTARAEAAMRMRVHTTRARTRTAIRVITAATVAMLVFLLLVSGDYLVPYGDLTGQVVLACAFALFAFGLWWLHRLATPPTAPSFLRTTSEEARS